MVSPDEDLVDHEADQKMRQEFQEFYMWCRENNMTFGSGDTFDQEKHDEARRLYAEHLYRQEHPEEFAAESETTEPEVPAIEEPFTPAEEPEPVHKKHGGKKAKEETEQVTTETAPTQEETLEEDTPSRNPRLQAMIDALQHDAEMAEQGHVDTQDSDEFGG